ncbi:LrgB family protein [Vibrio sp.]|nr:LrgB family protein [Vibrio sp.]
MWLLMTLCLYIVTRKISTVVQHPLVNPMILSLLVLVPALLLLEIPYIDYEQDTQYLTYLLQPAVVALAIPLYDQFSQIKDNWKLIVGACAAGSLLSMLSSVIIASFFDIDLSIVASLLGKSVTAPIAMAVSSELGGEPALAAIFVLMVGIFGAIFAYPVYKILNIRSSIAKGLTMGTISHALGTATCVTKDMKDAAFSSLAIVLCGVFTSFTAPLIYQLAVWL